MSFAQSADPSSIQLADGHYLVSTLQDSEGNWHEASIDLDHFIGNIDGEFQWGKVEFSQSTKNIWLDTAHAPALILLKGQAQKEDEDWTDESSINLNEFIQNVEGSFQYIGPFLDKPHASLNSKVEPPDVVAPGEMASSLPTPGLSLCGPPPADPPHIHTPPGSPSARPYAYPFLPSYEPRGDARPSVNVDVHPDKYVLACRMPHFDHSSITVATRRGRLLVIAADRWDTLEPAPLSLDPSMIPSPPQPAHFERRVTFGWDADMGRIRVEFDGVTLHITVPRRMFPAPTGGPREGASAARLIREYDMSKLPQSTAREVAWPLG